MLNSAFNVMSHAIRGRLFIYMTTISFDYKTFLKCTSSTRKKQKQLQLQNQIFNFRCNPISQNLPFTKVGCAVMTEKRTKSFIAISNKCFEAYQIKTFFLTGLSKTYHVTYGGKL